MSRRDRIFAAIDVGTNAVRLKMVRQQDGAREVLHEERDPIRPGEGVFLTGSIPPEVAERLFRTLHRYGEICRRHRAVVRAVGTSAVREAHNAREVLRRIKKQCGFELEVISGREEARLICLGVLEGAGESQRALVVDIGGGSTEVAVAAGEHPSSLYSLALGSVRLTEIFGTSSKVSRGRLRLVREYAEEVAERGLPGRIPGAPRRAIGCSGTIRAVVGIAAAAGTAHATTEQISDALGELVEMGPEGRRRMFDPRRAEIIVAGAAVLEAIARRLQLTSIASTDRGLRDGVLVDLARRHDPDARDRRLADAAIAFGRGFRFDERHAGKVAEIALTLFDALAPRHDLPRAWRRYLEVAALLHDIGHAIGYQRHHKHAAYLIQNGDIPGLADQERDLVARIARYHRRSPPEAGHSGMDGLGAKQVVLVRKLATILRLADALDRSHHQPIQKVTARLPRGTLLLKLQARGPLDLEMWDAEHETALFRQVFRRRLVLEATRA